MKFTRITVNSRQMGGVPGADFPRCGIFFQNLMIYGTLKNIKLEVIYA
ncbi:MAG TPA: hypothetical protein VFF47_01900 [Nitrospirota bacterium]|nr:hypothetical protein [Nitrospirota bacterium]